MQKLMMKNVLRIMTSPRGEASISRKLGNAIVERIQAKYPDSILRERDLVKDSFPHLQQEQINLFFTPTEQLTPEQAETLKNSTNSIAELQNADIIVIDAPMYNYTVTSHLKAYIDHIVRYKVTFLPTDQGVEGLIKNKKVYVAVSSGFVYSDEGAFKDFDLLTPYLKTTLGWIGMTNISFNRAEGMNIPGFQETALQTAIEGIVID
jgi:FMN-dependent NADH-azoreductase